MLKGTWEYFTVFVIAWLFGFFCLNVYVGNSGYALFDALLVGANTWLLWGSIERRKYQEQLAKKSTPEDVK